MSEARRRRHVASMVAFRAAQCGAAGARNAAKRRSNVANRWQRGAATVGHARALRYSRRTVFRHRIPLVSRRIAIVEDEPAIRANYADALRRQGYEVADLRRPRRGARRVPHAAARPRADRHRPGRRHRRRLRRCAASCARCRRRCRSSSCRRAIRISTSSRACASAPTTTSPRTRACRTSPRASPRCSGAATSLAAPPATEDVARARPADARRQAPHGATGTASASTSRSPSSGWCMRSRAIPGHVKDRDSLMRDAQHRRRRQHDHLARQAHPPQVPGGRCRVRPHRDRVRHGLSLARERDGAAPMSARRASRSASARSCCSC